MNKFIQFTSHFTYINNCRTHVNAAIQATDWFRENNEFEIVSWQALSTGKDNDLTIVVEYKERIYTDHY